MFEMKRELFGGLVLQSAAEEHASDVCSKSSQHRWFLVGAAHVASYSESSTRRIDSAKASQDFCSASSRRLPAAVIV